ncbi:MAG: binding domain of photolyase family protein [Verrucomicrobiaceae bacterium]|nr:binding domain of photolyase family protein [Verrucomicrobiaceae bacterium]
MWRAFQLAVSIALYAASGAYINKMSDYCSGCRYSPKIKTGPDACPFNYLYWHFFDQHTATFANNQRVKMPVNAWLKRSEEDKNEVRQSAALFLEKYVPESGQQPCCSNPRTSFSSPPKIAALPSFRRPHRLERINFLPSSKGKREALSLTTRFL